MTVNQFIETACIQAGVRYPTRQQTDYLEFMFQHPDYDAVAEAADCADLLNLAAAVNGIQTI